MFNDLGRFIQQRRLKLKRDRGADYDQGGVAARSGISQKVLSDIETGKISYLPQRKVLEAIARELGVSYASLLVAADIIDADDLHISTEQIMDATPLAVIIAAKYGEGVPPLLIEEWEETAQRQVAKFKVRQAAQTAQQKGAAAAVAARLEDTDEGGQEHRVAA